MLCMYEPNYFPKFQNLLEERFAAPTLLVLNPFWRGSIAKFCWSGEVCSKFGRYLGKTGIINRPGVAGAVLQTPLSLIN